MHSILALTFSKGHTKNKSSIFPYLSHDSNSLQLRDYNKEKKKKKGIPTNLYSEMSFKQYQFILEHILTTQIWVLPNFWYPNELENLQPHLKLINWAILENICSHHITVKRFLIVNTLLLWVINNFTLIRSDQQ